MSFSRFNPGCCCNEECVTAEWVSEVVSTSETEDLDSVTYDRYDIPLPNGQNVYFAASTADFILFTLSNGDLYRIGLTDLLTLEASGGSISIEKSTDSGSSWTEEQSCYMAPKGIGDGAETYFIDAVCGSESPTLTDDWVVDEYISSDDHVIFFGENNNGCYIGITADWRGYETSRYRRLVQPSVARQDYRTHFAEFSTGTTITDARVLRLPTGASMTFDSLRVNSYEDYNCASDVDPNCDSLCSASFPNMFLEVTQFELDVDSSQVVKTVTVDGDFPATDGFCSLPNADDTELSSAAMLTTVNTYTSTSQPEWSGVGIVRESIGNSTVYKPPISGLPVQGPVCEAKGGIRALDQWQQVPAKWMKTGNTLSTVYAGVAFPYALEFSWTKNVSEFGAQDFSAAISTLYNGSFYQHQDYTDKQADFWVDVVEETDCAVTLELVIIDYTLQHGDASAISLGSPSWDATITGVTLNGFGAYEFDIDATDTYNMPAGWGESSKVSQLGPDTTGRYQTKTNEYASDASNAGVDESEVLSERFPPAATSVGGFAVVRTGSTLDADWTAWSVTFRKTVLKSDLAAETTVVDFTSADLHSSNNPTARPTLIPYDWSQGYTMVDQLSTVSLSQDRPYLLTIAKPAGYSGTFTLDETDFSASVTLNNGVFYR